MKNSYNLLHEPWIHIVNMDGSTSKCGIVELFQNAHNLLDIKSPDFNGISFSIYESLVLRLLSGIYSDAMAWSNDGLYSDSKKVDSLEINNFDMSEDSPLSNYFKEFEDCFDLFGIHPFMQARDFDLTEEDLKKFDPMNPMKLNPVAVAADGRVFGAGLKNDIILEEWGEKGSPLLGLINSGVSFDKKQYKDAICSYYKLTPAEFVYILLYAHTYAPNVRLKGSVLCDVGHVQMMKGKNLKTTIVLNSCRVLEDEFAIPIWRWESINDGKKKTLIDAENVSALAILFYPSRLIRGYLSDDGYVRDIVLRSIFESDKEKQNYDTFKSMCQGRLDPYIAKKMFISPKQNSDEWEAYPIRCKDASPQWMRMVQASCSNSVDEVKKITTLTGAEELMISPEEFYRVLATNKGAVSNYGIRACIYYLTQGDKCKLLTSGKSESDISEEIFKNPMKTNAVNTLCNLIKASSDFVSKFEKEYIGSSQSSLKKLFYYRCEVLVGLSTKNPNGYFYKLENANTDEEISVIMEELRTTLAQLAKNTFRKISDPNRMIEYFIIENKLSNAIMYYGKPKKEAEK